MPTVMVPTPAADLAKMMSAMRSWLDRHQVQTPVFRYDVLGGGGLLMKLDFDGDRDAEAFAEEFEVRQTNATADK
jgi:hypothetical protein